MDELLLRGATVLGALAIGVLVAFSVRRRARGAVRQIDHTGLAAGPHFFSSTACGTCGSVRSELSVALGESGFTEHVWEDEPETFSELGVDTVPAILIVHPDGQGTLYPGKASKALEAI